LGGVEGFSYSSHGLQLSFFLVFWFGITTIFVVAAVDDDDGLGFFLF
jgi:hypothetical protein